MDQEGNIISPLGSFKVAPRPATTSSMSRSSPTTTTTVPTAAVTNSASTVGCLCCPLSGNISICQTFTTPAAPIVPQSTTASKAAVTSCTTRRSAAVSQSAPDVPQPTAAVRAAVTTTSRDMMGPTAVGTPARQVVRVPASEFCRSSGLIPAHGLSPCLTGGVRLPRSQQDQHKAAILDKDIIIARLRSEIEGKDLNSEGQLFQLLWLNTIVNEKETEICDKDLAISALEGTVSDQASTINQMQAKFIAIYNHCRDLAMDRQKKMDNITILLRMEEKAKVIQHHQPNASQVHRHLQPL